MTTTSSDTGAPSRTVASSITVFRDFVEPHWSGMARLAHRLSPPGQDEDVLQEALITAWRKRNQFDPLRGHARSWLASVVADKAYKAWRRHKPSAEMPDDLADAHSPSHRIDLDAALARLTARQQRVIALHYYAGLTVVEIAPVMKCSPGTVKSTLFEARKKLRAILGEDYPHE